MTRVSKNEPKFYCLKENALKLVTFEWSSKDEDSSGSQQHLIEATWKLQVEVEPCYSSSSWRLSTRCAISLKFSGPARLTWRLLKAYLMANGIFIITFIVLHFFSLVFAICTNKVAARRFWSSWRVCSVRAELKQRCIHSLKCFIRNM